MLMLYTSGSTSRGKMRMMVSVVMSSETRAPCFSLCFGTEERHPTMYRGPEEAFTMTARGGKWEGQREAAGQEVVGTTNSVPRLIA